ncbi:hypothetical protein [Okeania sp. SIO3B5]|nr:hypothetical protein [Okeania sp. SIO3B5]
MGGGGRTRRHGDAEMWESGKKIWVVGVGHGDTETRRRGDVRKW